MPTPGTDTNIVEAIQPAGNPTDTGLSLVIGETLRGPTTPTEVTSISDLNRLYGPRQPYGTLHDTLDLHFSTGGTRAIVSRIVAATATAATAPIPGTTGSSLTITATSTGDWGNNLRFQVVEGDTGYRIVKVLDSTTNKVLEQTPQHNALVDFVGWTGTYAKLTAGTGTGLPPIASLTALTGGDSKRGTIDSAAHTTALEKFTDEHGIGQLSAPGIFSQLVHLALLQAAATSKTRRFPVLDLDPTLTADQKTAYLQSLQAGEYGHLGTSIVSRVLTRPADGGTRWVPGSGYFTGRTNYTDSTAGVGQAAAGQEYGEHPYVLDVEDTYTDEERGALNDAGGICIVRINGQPRLYGARSLADVVEHPAFRWLTTARVVMRYKAFGDGILESHVLRRNSKAERQKLGNELNAFSEGERIVGNLDGDTPEEAYRIDTSDELNTKESRAAGWILADAEIRPPETAERVRLNLAVQVPGGTVSGS